MTPVLLDASVIVALLHQREEHHRQCAAFVRTLDRPLVTCEAVISESCILLRRSSGAVDAVMENVEQGIFQLPLRLADSAAAIRSLMTKYRDTPSSLADACLIRMAEELNTGDILTLDSDFRSYRWRKTRPFRLLLDEQ
ncbi:MAG: PIN domain-containing protein [Silvibacterium sp.]